MIYNLHIIIHDPYQQNVQNPPLAVAIRPDSIVKGTFVDTKTD